MVKVYFANIGLLEDAELFEKWLQRMNPVRKEKVEKCRQRKDKFRCLLAGILLRYALEHEGLVYEDLEFGITEHGKPFLKNVSDTHFSISHAGRYALCCISDNVVGADVEVLEKHIFEDEDKLCKTAKKILSKNEYQMFLDAKFEEKKKLFLKFWTQKESFSKAVGKGLGMDFPKIDELCNEGDFWSGWLREDCYVSVYTPKQRLEDMTIQQLNSLEF